MEEYLEKEVVQGKIVGPVSDTEEVQVSRFGAIPKSEPQKRRLMIDLSHLEEA